VEIRDTYNYNETEIRIGIGKKEKFIIISTASSRIATGKDINRESATIGETISGIVVEKMMRTLRAKQATQPHLIC
jgi:hypothetical protein